MRHDPRHFRRPIPVLSHHVRDVQNVKRVFLAFRVNYSSNHVEIVQIVLEQFHIVEVQTRHRDRFGRAFPYCSPFENEKELPKRFERI